MHDSAKYIWYEEKNKFKACDVHKCASVRMCVYMCESGINKCIFKDISITPVLNTSVLRLSLYVLQS